MSEIIFSHPNINTLFVPIRPNGISWAYRLNTAIFHTYGGEVVQILSTYIDNMTITGQVKKYEDAERIYEFFARYFTLATQGETADGGPDALRFQQSPVVMEYPEREWVFYLQPLSAPGFKYSREMTAPEWRLEAHIIDQELYNNQLKEYVNEYALKEIEKLGGNFQLTGELSPVNGDPAMNPFIAALVPGVSDGKSPGNEFEPIKAEEVMADNQRFASFFTSQIPSYLKGEFATVSQVAASSPVFGKAGIFGAQKERETEKQEEAKIKGQK